MIVVEGSDGTGKTTLVNQLAEDLRLRVGQRGTAKRDELYKVTREDTERALFTAISGQCSPTIWDRLGPFSEPIYSRVMSRSCAFSTSHQRLNLAILKALRCPVIFCIVPLETIQENIETTHQMANVKQNISYIAGAYESLAQSFEGGHTYDYRVPGAYDRLVENVIRPYILQRKDREWQS